jgi:hypothetical protein
MYPTIINMTVLINAKPPMIPILANIHAIMGLPSCPLLDLMTLYVVQKSRN